MSLLPGSRLISAAALAGVIVLSAVSATPASAQIVHSVVVGAGGFMPVSCSPGAGSRLDCLNARGGDDVLVENQNQLAFDISDFRGVMVFGEWNIAFKDRVELALGTSFYRHTVPSVYRDFVNVDRSEIEQQLRLRVIPVSAIVRFLPAGKAGDIQFFLGGGISALKWKYTETGEFIDFSNNFTVFEDTYESSGTTLAPVLVGGLRIPVRGDIYAVNGEARLQFSKASLGSNSGFLADKINLGGLTLTLGLQMRF